MRTPGRFDVAGAVVLPRHWCASCCRSPRAAPGDGASRWSSACSRPRSCCSVLWVPLELRVNQPMVDLRTSARRPVLMTNLASIFAGMAMFVNMLVTVQVLQQPSATGAGFGLGVTAAGLAMVPSGLAMVAMSPVSGWSLDPLGRPRGAARRRCADGPHLRRPRLLRRLGRRGRDRLDAGRDRHGPGLRRDADAHHVLGPDHRDSVGQRSRTPWSDRSARPWRAPWSPRSWPPTRSRSAACSSPRNEAFQLVLVLGAAGGGDLRWAGRPRSRRTVVPTTSGSSSAPRDGRSRRPWSAGRSAWPAPTEAPAE